MFTGKIRIDKNINGKEFHFKKTFHDEKDFNDFVEKNPDLRDLQNWETSNWPSQLFDINNFYDEADKHGNKGFFQEMEDDMKKFFEKSKKLIGK